MRLWSLTPLIAPLLLNIVTEQPWDRILGNSGEPGWGRGGCCPSVRLKVCMYPLFLEFVIVSLEMNCILECIWVHR